MYPENRGLIGYANEQLEKAAIVDSRPKTMRENIDRQIASCEAQMIRLQTLKAKLESGTSLLDLDMNDLRQGMNY